MKHPKGYLKHKRHFLSEESLRHFRGQ